MERWSRPYAGEMPSNMPLNPNHQETPKVTAAVHGTGALPNVSPHVSGGGPRREAPTTAGKLEHLANHNRFVFSWDGVLVGVADYRIAGNFLNITHT